MSSHEFDVSTFSSAGTALFFGVLDSLAMFRRRMRLSAHSSFQSDIFGISICCSSLLLLQTWMHCPFCIILRLLIVWSVAMTSRDLRKLGCFDLKILRVAYRCGSTSYNVVKWRKREEKKNKVNLDPKKKNLNLNVVSLILNQQYCELQ